MIRSKLLTCVFTIAFSALAAWPARAYVTEGLIWGVPTTPIVVNLTASQGQLGNRLPSFPLQDGSASFNQVLGNAISIWNSYLGNLQIQVRYGSNPQGVNENDNQSEVGFGTKAGGTNLDANTLAVSEFFYYLATKHFAQSFIVFNSSASAGWHWNSYRGPLQTPIDMRRVALHELGHFIGLGHPDQAGQNVSAIMNSVVSNTDNLTPDDIAGAETLYWPSARRVTQVQPFGDFNGDGNTDLVWRNAITGDVAVWYLNGTSLPQGAIVANVPLSYRLLALADLNGLGKSGLVWYNLSNGQYALWYLAGSLIQSSQTFSLPRSYPVAFFGDLSDLGETDAVQWSPDTGNLVISRGAGNLSFSAVYSTFVSTDWVLVGLTDIVGNGQKELVWRNQISGAVAVWFLSNFQFSSGIATASPDLSWTLRGIGRFNGSATDNFLWQNSVSGQVAIWNLNSGGHITSGTILSGRAAYPWALVDSVTKGGNSNHSGILWHNFSTAQSALWSVNGSGVSGSNISANTGYDWVLEPLGF